MSVLPINTDHEPLKIREKLAYGLGDFASNIVWKMTQYFLLYFYTDVYGITAMEAGSIFLIARVWDAVNDPAMGYIMDRTNTKWGRLRPYLLYGPIPLAVATVLCFSTPDLGTTGKYLFALLSYIFLGMSYTLVNLPYSALTGIMTQDAGERSTLSAMRILFGIAAGILISTATKPLVALFPNSQTGWQMVLLSYAVLSVLIFWICFNNITERVEPIQKKHYSFREMLQIVRTNTPMLLLAGSAFLMMTAYTLKSAATMYFLKYNLGREDLVPLFFLFTLVASASALIGVVPLIKKIGKRLAAIYSGWISVFGFIILYFTPAENISLVMLFASIAAFGSAAPLVCAWSMLADTVEYAEWKTGLRGDGIIYSVFSFVLKLATAIGGSLGSFILGYTGYVANAAAQSKFALQGIALQIALLPGIAGVLAIICLFYYSLSAEKFEQIKLDLKQRKTIT